MCIIIIKQEGKLLPKEVAKTSGRINPHGLGIIWLDTFEVTYHKSSEHKVLDTERTQQSEQSEKRIHTHSGVERIVTSG